MAKNLRNRAILNPPEMHTRATLSMHFTVPCHPRLSLPCCGITKRKTLRYMLPCSVLALISKPMGGYDLIGSQDPHLIGGAQIRTRPSRQRRRLGGNHLEALWRH